MCIGNKNKLHVAAAYLFLLMKQHTSHIFVKQKKGNFQKGVYNMTTSSSKVRRSLICFIAAMIMIFSTWASAATSAASGAFRDVKGHWAEPAIKFMAEKGMRGYPDGTFRPDQFVSEEEFITMLRYVLPPIEGKHVDQFTRELYLKKATGRWSEESYTKMMLAGILPREAAPVERIQRITAAHMALAALASLHEGEKYRNTKARFFSDVPTSGENAEYESIIIYPVYKMGIMIGDQQNRFRPYKHVTRAEAAVILKRLYDYIQQHYPDTVPQQQKKQLISSLKGFFDTIAGKNFKTFDELVQYVEKHKLPVTRAFLDEHFWYMKLDGVDYASRPDFDELMYFSRGETGIYRIIVQYYAGELGGNMSMTYYVRESADRKTLILISSTEADKQ